MKVWKILQSLENLEESMARYYGVLHLHYADKPEVAGFFARMRDEELSHRDIVRYQQRIMFKSPESFKDLTDLDQGDSRSGHARHRGPASPASRTSRSTRRCAPPRPWRRPRPSSTCAASSAGPARRSTG